MRAIDADKLFAAFEDADWFDNADRDIAEDFLLDAPVVNQTEQPDPDTELVPCGWCGPERIGWFSVQFWVRASTGKRKWMSVTQQYKKQVNYCPMCGRKLEGRQ